MFRRKRVHKKTTFPQVRKYSQLLKKPFVDKSKWFKEVPAEEWKEAPAPAPTLKPSTFQIPSTPLKNPASFLNVSTPTPLRIFTDKERLRNSEERKRLKVARDHSGKPKKPKKVIPEEIPLVDFIPDTPQRNLNVKLDPSNKKEKSERKISNTTNKFNDSIYDQIDVSFDDDLYTTYQSK
jgi:hypothetical protein